MSTTAPVLETSWKNREWIIWPSAFLVLICVLYAPILKALILDWWTDPDYGHGFLVPLISGYVLWHQRSRWLNVEIKPSNFGFLVMLGGIVLLLGGSLGAELFVLPDGLPRRTEPARNAVPYGHVILEGVGKSAGLILISARPPQCCAD